MFGRIKSALFIDFENMALAPECIENWLPWLEDGHYDRGKLRKFVLKRVYWNSSAQKHEAAYKAHGFDVVHCDRFVGLTNSVDIQMAIDIVDTTHQFPRIEEYILVTQDSDYVPVLRRLKERHKRTAFFVDENRPNIHTIYRPHANTLISKGDLTAARRYVRPAPGILARIVKPSRRTTAGKARLAEPTTAVAKPTPAKGAAPRLVATPKPQAAPATVAGAAGATLIQQIQFKNPATVPASEPLEKALACVIKRVGQNPNKFTAKSVIIKALQTLPDFAVAGKASFVGLGAYDALMFELAKHDPRLAVAKQPDGGVSVKFVPQAEPQPVAAATSSKSAAPATLPPPERPAPSPLQIETPTHTPAPLAGLSPSRAQAPVKETVG